MESPAPKLCLLLLVLLASCRNEPPKPPTVEERDRRELVRQPKEEWKPGAATRRLEILLLAERSRIRKGEPLNYRLEMRNVGREPLVFTEEAPSFIKEGSLCGSHGFKFHVAPPRGKERALTCAPEVTDEVQIGTRAAAAPEPGLDLTLAPGEYLLTRGSGPGRPFRTLTAAEPFDQTGIYRLKAVLTRKNFRAESNAIAIEVVP